MMSLPASLSPLLQVKERVILGPSSLRVFTQEVVPTSSDEKEDLPTLVLTPGWLQSTHVWQMQRELVAQGLCRVIAWDLPLQGRSLPDPRVVEPIRLSADLYAHALRAVLCAYRLLEHPAILVGWSFGGVVIQHYLARYGTQGIKRLVLVGSGIGDLPLSAQEREAMLSPVVPIHTREGIAQMRAVLSFVERLTSIPMGAPVREMLLSETVRSLCQIQAYAEPKTILGLFGDEGAAEEQTRKVESALQHLSVLILHGEADGLVPVSLARAMQTHLPHGHLQIHPSCGHTPQMEDSIWFNHHLAQWLTS